MIQVAVQGQVVCFWLPKAEHALLVNMLDMLARNSWQGCGVLARLCWQSLAAFVLIDYWLACVGFPGSKQAEVDYQVA